MLQTYSSQGVQKLNFTCKVIIKTVQESEKPSSLGVDSTMNQQPLHLKLTTQVNVHKHPFVHITVTCFFIFLALVFSLTSTDA